MCNIYHKTIPQTSKKHKKLDRALCAVLYNAALSIAEANAFDKICRKRQCYDDCLSRNMSHESCGNRL